MMPLAICCRLRIVNVVTEIRRVYRPVFFLTCCLHLGVPLSISVFLINGL